VINWTVCFLWARGCCMYVIPSYYDDDDDDVELEASGDHFMFSQDIPSNFGTSLCLERAAPPSRPTV
jgi:hypothetical protein